MRYHGQAFELVVPWGDVTRAGHAGALLARFHALHAQRFSYANPDDPVEIVTLRLTATGQLPQARRGQRRGRTGRRAARAGRCSSAARGSDVPVLRRAALTGPSPGPAADRGGLHHRVHRRRLDVRARSGRRPDRATRLPRTAEPARAEVGRSSSRSCATP